MAIDLFTPIVPAERQHRNFIATLAGPESVRAVVTDWADGFIDRDGKFVDEFQRTYNSSWWELYLFAVLKSLDLKIDFGFDAPDFVLADHPVGIEAVIAGHGQGMTPEWEKTLKHVTDMSEIESGYAETLVRLSNAIDSKVRRYRGRYAGLPHMAGRAYVIAVHNFSTPDAHQLGDSAMQRLLYDTLEEGSFLKNGKLPLPTGLFLDDGLKDVSAVIYSSLATYGKARALSAGNGGAVFQAIRIRNQVESIRIGALKADYQESLRDGLRLFRNPHAATPVPDGLFEVEDILEFGMDDGELWTRGHPEGDLCMRQVLTFNGGE